jgi:branched-chain amino acid transport system permease protein
MTVTATAERKPVPGTTAELQRPLDVPAMLKEALITALICAVLTGLIIGVRTTEGGGALSYETDFTSVAIVCALVFFGRIGVVLNRERRYGPVLVGGLVAEAATWLVPLVVPWHTVTLMVIAAAGSAWLVLQALFGLRRRALGPAASERSGDRLAAGVQHATRYVGPLLVVFAVIAPFALPYAQPALEVLGMDISQRAFLGVMIIILLYIMLGWGLNIIVGLAGLLDLGYVAFYAVGAYSYALLSTEFGWSFWACLPLAGLLAASAGIILGYPVLRLRGDYFAIVTLGFGEIVRIVLINWAPVTNGPNGINNIPRPTFFGLPFDRNPPEGVTSFSQYFGIEYDPVQRILFLYFLVLALALLVNFVSQRVRRLPLGRAWEALREDDIACQSLGINKTNLKLAAFATSAMCGGFAGSFFATYQGFISPESFSFIESAIILAIVVLGGMGSQLGIVIAAVLIIGLPEIFRELDLYRMLVFGLCMVGIMIWRPGGLLSHRDPSILLHKGARR